MHDRQMQQALAASYQGDPQEKMKDTPSIRTLQEAPPANMRIYYVAIHRALQEAAADEAALASQFRE